MRKSYLEAKMNIYQNVVPKNGTEEGRKGLATIQNSHSSLQRNFISDFLET
ncbi:MAG TPA: hypothetical protein VIL90_12005 [Puia sp.]